METIARNTLRHGLRGNIVDIIPLHCSEPDPSLVPTQELAEAARSTLLGRPEALQYGLPEGRLKEHIVELMRYRQVQCQPGEILLTTGARQALSLVTRYIGNEGACTVITGSVLPAETRSIFESFADAISHVQVQSDGRMDLEPAMSVLKKERGSAFLYAMSCGYDPLTVTMTASARLESMEFASRHNLPIVENDVHGFMQYSAAPEPCLCSMDRSSVFYVGSFSPLVAPALRVGWVVAPVRHVESLSVLKEGSDINTSTLAQRILCRYLDSHPLVNGRLEFLNSQYKLRRDAMGRALRMHFKTLARWNQPLAGFSYWVEGAHIADTEQLLTKSLEHGVSFVPGSRFTRRGISAARSALRLSFSCLAPGRIDEAIKSLGKVVEQVNECKEEKRWKN